jgi:hypothetical protein
MYRKVELAPKPPSEFELPFGGSLSPDNRWVKMTELILWSEFEAEYAKNFPTEMSAAAKSFRMALGALIIKENWELAIGKQSNKSGKTRTCNTLSVN